MLMPLTQIEEVTRAKLIAHELCEFGVLELGQLRCVLEVTDMVLVPVIGIATDIGIFWMIMQPVLNMDKKPFGLGWGAIGVHALARERARMSL